MGEEVEPRKVICLNCGHTWFSKSARPQCGNCKSKRVEEVESEEEIEREEEREEEKDIKDFFELDDSTIDELVEDKPKVKAKGEKSSKLGKIKGIGVKVSSKVGAGAIVIGVVILFAFLMLRSIARKKSKKIVNDVLQEEDEGFDPYGALG